MLRKKTKELLNQFSRSEKLAIYRILISKKLLQNIPKHLLEAFDIFQNLIEKDNQIERLEGNNVISYGDQFIDNLKFKVRRNSSDLMVVNQVIINHAYLAFIQFINEKINDSNPIKYILDGGANIGCTTIYFSKYFSESKIYSVEPDDGNFSALESNLTLNHISNCQTLNCGIWSKSGYLSLKKDFRAGREWAIRLGDIDENSKVKSFTLSEILSSHNIPYLDILKLDIEGGEKEVFKNDPNFLSLLSRVRFISIEIHPEFISEEEILLILTQYGFECKNSGESIIGYNHKFQV